MASSSTPIRLPNTTALASATLEGMWSIIILEDRSSMPRAWMASDVFDAHRAAMPIWTGPTMLPSLKESAG